MTSPDTAEYVWGPLTVRAVSGVRQHGCEPERIALSIKRYVDQWSLSPGMKFVVNPSRRLLQVLDVSVDEGILTCTLVDVINFTNLNLALDPRKVPAQVDDVKYSAKWRPEWAPLFLLCVFDQLRSAGAASPGEYPIWGGALVASVTSPEDGHVRLEDLSGKTVEFYSGADL